MLNLTYGHMTQAKSRILQCKERHARATTKNTRNGDERVQQQRARTTVTSACNNNECALIENGVKFKKYFTKIFKIFHFFKFFPFFQIFSLFFKIFTSFKIFHLFQIKVSYIGLLRNCRGLVHLVSKQSVKYCFTCNPALKFRTINRDFCIWAVPPSV